MPAIELQDLTQRAGTVRYEFTYPEGLRRFFSGADLVVEYDEPIEDVPRGLLAVPWVANVCPIAWATGTDVQVPTLDAGFAQAIPRVGAAFADLYPDLVEGSTIRVGETTGSGAVPAADEGTAAMLFSGGVDSVATYYRHQDESPLLISVHGHDVAVDDTEGWAKKRDTIERFATARELETRFVHANVVSFQEPFLLYAHFGETLQSDWIESVHLGLGLTGLCAPLAHAEGIEVLYVADSVSRFHVETSTDQVANHPTVVGRLGWSTTTVHNDGFPLTRQEKVDLIADRIGDEPLELHVCLDTATGNCSRCEKCLRTALALFLAGLDPNEYGFDIDGETLEYTRDMFETGAWTLDGARPSYWRDLQQTTQARREDLVFESPDAAAFFDWLAGVDIDRFVKPDRQIQRELLCAVARHTPYPVYAQARNADPVVSLATRLLDR